MAEKVTPSTKAFTRKELGAFLPSLEAIIKFEKIVRDLTDVYRIPLNNNADELDEIRSAQASGASIAQAALGVATAAKTLVDAVEFQAGQINQLQARLARAERALAESGLDQSPQMRARLARVERAVSDLQEIAR